MMNEKRKLKHHPQSEIGMLKKRIAKLEMALDAALDQCRQHSEAYEKRIAELDQENIRLQDRNDELFDMDTAAIDELQQRIAELESQVNKECPGGEGHSAVGIDAHFTKSKFPYCPSCGGKLIGGRKLRQGGE